MTIKEEIIMIINRAVKEELKKEVSAKSVDITDIDKVVVGIYTSPAYINTDYTAVVSKLSMQENRSVYESIKRNGLTKTFSNVTFEAGHFFNFTLSEEYLQRQIREVLKRKEKYGDLDLGKSKKVQVEFISANPTGPLTLGNGRGGFCGDVLANVLAKAGYQVEREYYVNDRGEQIKKLGHSVIGDDQAVYKGDYIKNLELDLVKFKDPEEAGEKAAKIILETMLKPTIQRMGIKYDIWFSEKSLYKRKEVQKALEGLKKQGLAYEKEGALWFKSTQFGDDKDRVLIKSDGEETYLASDVAYLKNKKDRGFDKIIYFWGADHHGYVSRLKAASQALGYNKDDVEIILMQLVKLFRGGKEVRMSKREGVYVTLDELFDELCSVNPLGMDVARFFFLTRTSNTHLNFDLDLAKEQSEKNPVFYIQYAHARICSILKKAKKQTGSNHNDRYDLNHPSELKLIKQLIRLPEVVEDTAQDYQVQRLPQYAHDLAVVFHKFYTDCRVIDEDKKDLTQARLALVQATKIVLKNTLDLMGISAPSKM